MEHFTTERAVYDQMASGLTKHHLGEYALIMGSELLGVYPNSREAYRAGLRRAGLDAPFFMHQIGAERAPYRIHGVRSVARPS